MYFVSLIYRHRFGFRATHDWEMHMDVMVWGACGALIGWLASRVQRPGDRQGVLPTVAGILGALLGGGLVSPVAGHFHLPALLMSLAGAALLVVAVHVLRRGSLR